MATHLPKITKKSNGHAKHHAAALLQEGTSYQLANNKVPHRLPSPAKLKPFVDRISGDMETWPANSNAMSSSQVKPTFLLKLEGYLSRELCILGSSCDELLPEKRLQAFREVFEYLIDDFRTYKPLLSAIKREYENMLQGQRETIRSLQPLKAMLVNVNEKCEQKVLSMKQDDKKDLALAEQKNEELNNSILSLREEIVSLNEQIERCQSEVQEVYQKYRDESDSKKLLIQSMNDLKYQHEDSQKALLQQPADAEAREEEDCVFLRIALKKAREDLNKRNTKLAEVLADYGDVVPRRDFEKTEATLSNSKEECEVLKTDYSSLLKEHSELIEVHEKLIEQRDSLATDTERMRYSATPRPDWAKCGLYIEGGHERWQEMSTEKSTNDKLDIILAEMTGQDIAAIKSGEGALVEFFEPKGIGADIPAYLQSMEQVRNRCLSKHDLLVMIKDIWTQKINLEGNTPFTMHTVMQEYLHTYLKQCFGVDKMVIEWGYNVHDALERFNSEGNIALFSAILKGDVDEDVYYKSLSQLEALYNILELTDGDREAKGTLTKDEFENCITKYFVSFTSDGLSDLLQAAMQELHVGDVDDPVPYIDLFTEDDAGNTGPFLNLLRQLLKQDKESYLKEIQEKLGDRLGEDVSRVDFTEAFQLVDSKVGEELLGEYVSIAFGEVAAVGKLDLVTVMQNLQRSCIARTF